MRLEYKYYIPNIKLNNFRNDLKPYIKEDKFVKDGKNEYTVRSIYFDNRKLDYYFEKIEGVKVRKKVRIRGYDYAEGSNLIFLELKKKYENFIYKNRSPLMYEDLDRLLHSGDIEKFISEKFANSESVNDGKRFFFHLVNKSLRPVVLITYEREAFSCKFDKGLRITFDKNLRYFPFPSIADLYRDENLNKVPSDSSIIEIKFRHSIPKWLYDLINKYGLIKESISKYVICLDDYANHRPLNGIVRLAFVNHFITGFNSSQGKINNG